MVWMWAYCGKVGQEEMQTLRDDGGPAQAPLMYTEVWRNHTHTHTRIRFDCNFARRCCPAHNQHCQSLTGWFVPPPPPIGLLLPLEGLRVQANTV